MTTIVVTGYDIEGSGDMHPAEATLDLALQIARREYPETEIEDGGFEPRVSGTGCDVFYVGDDEISHRDAGRMCDALNHELEQALPDSKMWVPA